MLGIIIGIGSVIIITSIGKGNQEQITSSFDKLGVGRLTVRVRNNKNATRNDNLNMADYDLLKKLDQVKYISPVYSGNNMNVKLEDPTKTKSANVSGVSADYKDITNPEISYGRYISENDVDTGNKVVVINDTTAQKIFGVDNAVGQKISLKYRNGTQKLTVIGILKNANASIENMYGDQYPENLVMPISTLQKMFNTKTISQIEIVVKDTDVIDDTSALITTKLEEKHQNEDKYYVQNIMQQMEQINQVMSLITMFISAVAGISLVVGGIGVMNIMLVTVTERTREIGIRKSIGARNSDIRSQFIIEAIILTGSGGILGILLGWGGGIFVGKLMNISPIMTPQYVLIAVAISSLIGIVFGVYPANKAAKLDPIEALRYE